MVLTVLSLILADSALELVPKELWGHPSVVKHARSRGKKSGEVLLDRSLHHSAMLKLQNNEKRGRPDIVHFALLEATSTPLYIKGFVMVYVHTYQDLVIYLSESLRLPKSYPRFLGLMEQLFKEKSILSADRVLLRLEKKSFQELVKELGPSKVVGFSRIGERKPIDKIAFELSMEQRPCIVVGAFPRGHFSDHVLKCLDSLYSIHDLSLETHLVVARILYEYEKLVLPFDNQK